MERLTEVGFLMKFYEKWKKKQLSKAAKKLLDDNPELEKNFKKLDSIAKKMAADTKKGLASY